jgi:hypothetical protein
MRSSLPIALCISLCLTCYPARAARGSIQIAGHGWASYKSRKVCVCSSHASQRVTDARLQPLGEKHADGIERLF